MKFCQENSEVHDRFKKVISLNFLEKEHTGWNYYVRWLRQIEKATIAVVLREH